MARGNVKSIPTGTATLQKTLNGEVREAIRILNPNDGVVYVAINGSASPTTFDFVVPSQSYAALPGPWMEYGLYFLDQSGAGRTGVVTVYESNDRLEYPDYHAIGRSLQAQVSSMDVTQGAQPANPPTGVERIWIDSANAFGVLIGSGITNWDFRDMIRTTGSEQVGPSAGSGVEIGYQPGATPPLGFVQAFNRSTGAYQRLDIHGQPINLSGGATGGIVHSLDDATGHSLTQTQACFRMRTVSPANAGVAQALWATGAAQGVVFLIDGFGRVGFFSFRNNGTLKISDPDNVWSTVAGNPATNNFYWNAGNNRYEVQNNSNAVTPWEVYTWSNT